MRRLLGLLLASACVLPLACTQRQVDQGPNGSESAAPPARGPAGAGAQGDTPPAPAGELGDGFVVWESNRTGDWRIWGRALEPSEPRQVTPDESGRQHCCPHISPDGGRIAYLSFPTSAAGYAAGGAAGELRSIRFDGGGERLLAPAARSSWENRAAVWRGNDELVYIRGDGATVLHFLQTDRTEVLLRPPSGPGEKTWLVNSRLSHAASGLADFSVYRRGDAGNEPEAGGTLAARSTYGGCQPYFSHDGRWGFWTAGTGGPLNRIDLATGRVSTILSKSDPRVPDGLGYAYFPMFSRDGRLFAFAASDYEHNHFTADYEIFVAPSDPDSLELLGNAVRMTSHPATDRFPDVFLEPLALGRLQGEAPFEVEFQAPAGAEVLSWSFGDGGFANGPSARHVFEQPGAYLVRALPPGRERPTLRGQVVVTAARPPLATGVELQREGRLVVVEFDEEIAADQPILRFESGLEVTGWRLGANRRTLVIEPASRIDGFERLHLEGISDRAQKANWIRPTALEVEPPLWPSDRGGLAFLWQTGNAANLIWDGTLGIERASSITGAGRAFLDHEFAMTLDGGRFLASEEDSRSIVESCRRSNELSFEAVITPAAATGAGLRRIISLSGGTLQSRNFFLAQRGDLLVFGSRPGGAETGSAGQVEIVRLPAATTSHILIAYRVGRLVAYLNGEQVLETESVQGDFFHWRPRPLLFGDGPGGGETWRGGLEGVAVYSRFVEADEARENYLRYRSERAARPVVERLVVDAILTARSRAPSLQEITPYRQALAVFEYRVERVLEGTAPGGSLRVAHWSILDGETLEINRESRVGDRLRLVVERFADNPQLESLYLADTLEPKDSTLFYAVPF